MSERGMTVVEVLVAMALLGMAAGVIMSGFMAQLHNNNLSEIRATAISAAEMELEELRMQEPATMPTGGASTPRLVTVGERVFAVTTHYCERSDLCTSGTSRYVRVAVGHEGTDVYDVEAIFTQLR